MRFLANENVPLDAVSSLRQRGHDVAWVRIDTPGSQDEEILARAISEERVLITSDKDFGYLALCSRFPAKSGVILFRVTESSPSSLAEFIVSSIESRSDWTGHFSVIEKNRIRMRPLV